MNVNLSIKGVPESVAERLRQRAERNHRSLQGELMAIVVGAVAQPGEWLAKTEVGTDGTVPSETSPGGIGRRWTQGWKTVEQLTAERRATGWRPHPTMTDAPTGTDIVRADRDSR